MLLATLVGVVVVVGVRALTSFAPLRIDESGYLIAARALHLGGPGLYGHYFVDRPPGLMAIFWVAGRFSSLQAIHVIATLGCVVTVLAAAWAAWEAAGPRGVPWAVAVATGLTLSPVLQSDLTNGELLAIPFVMVSVAATMAALRSVGLAAFGFALLAGVTAGMAVMVKQNFVDGLIFAVVLLAVALLQRRISGRQGLLVSVSGVLGAGAVALAAAGYAVLAGVGVGELVYVMYGFRLEALQVLSSDGIARQSGLHLSDLTRAALWSGLLPLGVLLVLRVLRQRLRGSPVSWAVGVTAAYGIVSVVSGGSYWLHYLIQLVPMAALACALAAPRSRWFRVVTTLVVVSALAFSVMLLLVPRPVPVVGDWLARSKAPADTVVTVEGHPAEQLVSGMSSPYPYLWSLPRQVLDPRLLRLRQLLGSARQPTWVVLWGTLDPHQVDPQGYNQAVLVGNYHQVAEVCGARVWLLDGYHRTLAPLPSHAVCGNETPMSEAPGPRAR